MDTPPRVHMPVVPFDCQKIGLSTTSSDLVKVFIHWGKWLGNLPFTVDLFERNVFSVTYTLYLKRGTLDV